MNGQAGKGSDPRPVDKKKYRENFDKIDWSKKSKPAGLDVGKGKDVTGFSVLKICDAVNEYDEFQKKCGKEILTGKY